MGEKGGGRARATKGATRTFIFLATLVVLVVIPVGVMYGRWSKNWMLLSNIFFCVALAGIAAGGICWMGSPCSGHAL